MYELDHSNDYTQYVYYKTEPLTILTLASISPLEDTTSTNKTKEEDETTTTQSTALAEDKNGTVIQRNQTISTFIESEPPPDETAETVSASHKGKSKMIQF